MRRSGRSSHSRCGIRRFCRNRVCVASADVFRICYDFSVRLNMSKRLADVLWWIGVPVIVGLITWGPYVSLNILNHVSWPFWRIPFVPIYVFDSSAYYQWIGAALSGLTYGSHIRSFDWIIRILGYMLPNAWSVAEMWLLTLWASATAGIWLMARCIARWSDCSVGHARWFSILALSSFMLPFMPRPGVYTWYVGFYALSLIGIWYVQRSLHRMSYPSAAGWTVMSLLVAWVYPYFLIHVFLWLAVLWFVHLHHRFPRAIRVIGGVGILTVIPTVLLMMPVILRPEFRLTYELQERIGLAWTRLPVLSNSLLVACVWLGMLMACTRMFSQRSAEQARLYGVAVGWITLVAAWLSNIFTGVYIHNDHFRNPVLIFSWVSLFVVYELVQKSMSNADQPSLFRRERGSRMFSRFVFACLVVSGAVFCVYLLRKEYVFHGDLLNAVHVSHWLTLTAASWMLWRFTRGTRTASALTIAVISILAVVPGVLGRGYVFAQEMKIFPSYEMYARTIVWIREHVAESDGVCADPKLAVIIGSFAARFAYPTYATVMLPKSDEEVLSDLKTELKFFSPSDDFEKDVYFSTLDSMRGTTCSQFTILKKISVSLGVSSAAFDVAAACPRDLSRNQTILRDSADMRQRDDERFARLCPVVITTPETRSRWQLPDEYSETKIDQVFSAWAPKR